MRHQLPVPMDPYGYADVSGRVTHQAPAKPPAPSNAKGGAPPSRPSTTPLSLSSLRVVDGGTTRPPTPAEHKAVAGMAQAMKRSAMVRFWRESGASEEAIKAALGNVVSP